MSDAAITITERRLREMLREYLPEWTDQDYSTYDEAAAGIARSIFSGQLRWGDPSEHPPTPRETCGDAVSMTYENNAGRREAMREDMTDILNAPDPDRAWLDALDHEASPGASDD